MVDKHRIIRYTKNEDKNKPTITFNGDPNSGICQMEGGRTSYVLDGREVDVYTYALAITARHQKLIQDLWDIKTY